MEEVLSPKDGIGVLLSRVPDTLRKKSPVEMMALHPAGCEIRFNLESKSAKITLVVEESAAHWPSLPAILEVYQGVFPVSWHIVNDDEPSTIQVNRFSNDLLVQVSKETCLPFDPCLTRVILPYYPIVRLMEINGKTCLPREGQTPKTRVLAYGSSITHGCLSIRPTSTFPFRLSQLLGFEVLNLGFAGGARFDTHMANYISSRNDWDLSVFETGLNMVGKIEIEECKKRVEYFLNKVVEAHPDKWVFCIDIFTFAADFSPSSRGLVNEHIELREFIKTTIKEINMPKLVHIEGREVLKQFSNLHQDLIHPSSVGMEKIASGLSCIIKDKIGSKTKVSQTMWN